MTDSEVVDVILFVFMSGVFYATMLPGCTTYMKGYVLNLFSARKSPLTSQCIAQDFPSIWGGTEWHSCFIESTIGTSGTYDFSLHRQDKLVAYYV